VVAGYRLVSGTHVQTLILRLTADGVLDTSFSGNGWDALTIQAGFSLLFDVAVQPDGKIVAVGSTAAPGAASDHCVVRYRADGTLDPDFDGDGITRFDLGVPEGSDRAVALHSSGQILTAGNHLNGSLDQSVFRLHSDGSLDTGWGGTGYVFLDPLGGAVEEARAIALDGDGRAVVAGWSGSLMCVARLVGNPPTTAVGDTEIGTDLRVAAPSPNPASSRMALSLHVGEAGRVRVELFDVAGRLVRRLFEENVSAGPRIVTWDLRDDAGRPVGDGLYLARITMPARSSDGLQ
jgi:uncharacterized delta-60 repeat protein